MIKFSIIMPAYNAENTLQYSISSVVKQTYSNWELIIVDDGSTDATARVIEGFKRTDERIVYLYQDNAGPGVARNHGIAKAKGEYIAFLDSDDYWDEDFLDIIEEKIQLGADYIFYENYYEAPIGNVLSTSSISSNKSEKKDTITRRQLTGMIPWGMSKVIKITLLSNTNFENIMVGEENIFSFETIKVASNIAFVDKPIYHYVQTQNSQHTKGGLDPWKEMLESMKYYMIASRQIEKYRNTINSLAVKALSISCYRISTSMNYNLAIKEMKKKILEYKKDYDFKKVEKCSLDRKTITTLWFIKLNWLTPIYIASGIRKGNR